MLWVEKESRKIGGMVQSTHMYHATNTTWCIILGKSLSTVASWGPFINCVTVTHAVFWVDFTPLHPSPPVSGSLEEILPLKYAASRSKKLQIYPPPPRVKRDTIYERPLRRRASGNTEHQCVSHIHFCFVQFHSHGFLRGVCVSNSLRGSRACENFCFEVFFHS